MNFVFLLLEIRVNSFLIFIFLKITICKYKIKLNILKVYYLNKPWSFVTLSGANILELKTIYFIYFLFYFIFHLFSYFILKIRN